MKTVNKLGKWEKLKSWLKVEIKKTHERVKKNPNDDSNRGYQAHYERSRILSKMEKLESEESEKIDFKCKKCGKEIYLSIVGSNPVEKYGFYCLGCKNEFYIPYTRVKELIFQEYQKSE